MGDERIFDALRPDGGKRTVAPTPRQLSRPSQGLIIDDVEREQRPPLLELDVEPLETCATLHGGKIHETDRA
jgi:hypothetical protein